MAGRLVSMGVFDLTKLNAEAWRTGPWPTTVVLKLVWLSGGARAAEDQISKVQSKS
jgi:predicted RecA/RadA family phage recombinase